MRKNSVETIMGAVVIAVAVLFVLFAYDKADLTTVEGYAISAKFDRIDGIRRGSDVRMSGIKIGTVTDQALDPEPYLAVEKLNIDTNIKLPLDTTVAITSDGLLGDKYMALSPGGDDKMIPVGGEIKTTQGSIDLFSLGGQMIFSQTGDKGGKAADVPK